MTDIYVGARIEHGSERDVLRRALTALGRDQREAVILANLHLGGRQIDLIVAQEELVLVIEAKGVSRPIRGGVNGPWQYRAASGDWVDFGGSGNPYGQARTAKHKVRDALSAMVGSDVPHMAAAVIFVPGIPDGSEAYEGDFSVSVGGLDDLRGLLRRRGSSALTLDDWRAFADQHRLRRASGLENACDTALFEAEDLIRQYITAFRRDHAQPGAVVPFACRMDGRDVSSRDVLSLIAEERADVAIQGPSGCGKTLLATKAALALTDTGSVPVMIPVKDYAGNLKAVLESEVRVLIDSQATKLLRAARRLNRAPVFVLDGYNECAQTDRAALTGRVAALARLYRGSVLVTSQITLARADRLQLREVLVPPPDMDTKEAIALTWTGGAPLPEQLRPLLEAVGSGLEARLVGEVGEEMRPDGSRYALFDAFTRKRLGDSAAEGIRLLSHLAGCLADRVAFSLPELEFNRLTDRHGVSQEVALCVQRVGLVAARGHRVSFAHEMYFDAFAAENVVRRADDVTAPVLEALASPKHAGRKGMILGAIANDVLRAKVFGGLEDADSIALCLEGACGGPAREWSERLCRELLEKVRAETMRVSFRSPEHEQQHLAFEEKALTAWTPLEQAFLAAICRQVAGGLYLKEILDVIGVLDLKTSREEVRLRETGWPSRLSLRDCMFANAYVFPSSPSPAISQFASNLHGRYVDQPCDAVARTISEGTDSLTPGQVYFLLMVSRGARGSASFITKAIASHWLGAPYHLKLDLMDGAVMCRLSAHTDRAALAEAIEALPAPNNVAISTMQVEALGRLGALEDAEREHVDEAAREMRQCICDTENEELCVQASGLYANLFDHPLSGAYYKALSDLTSDDRKTLLMMAASGAQAGFGFRLPLLVDLASFDDRRTAECFSRWVGLPPTDSVMPQDAIAVFAVTHVVLGRLGAPLPRREGPPTGHSAAALVSCGEVLYWLNRNDLDEAGRCGYYTEAFRVLRRHERGAALDVLRLCETELRSYGLAEGLDDLPGSAPVERSIISSFPSQVVEIGRHALADSPGQVGYFESWRDPGRERNLSFAIDVLAHYGNSTDLQLLKKFAEDVGLGTSAISAVRTLEARLAGAS